MHFPPQANVMYTPLVLLMQRSHTSSLFFSRCVHKKKANELQLGEAKKDKREM
jgi:hypothetical protein